MTSEPEFDIHFSMQETGCQRYHENRNNIAETTEEQNLVFI
jgi:hypothetical protein